MKSNALINNASESERCYLLTYLMVNWELSNLMRKFFSSTCECSCVHVSTQQSLYIIEEKFFSTIQTIQCLALIKHLSSKQMFTLTTQTQNSPKTTANATTKKLKTKNRSALVLLLSLLLCCICFFSLLEFCILMIAKLFKIHQFFSLSLSSYWTRRRLEWKKHIHTPITIFFKYLEWLAH